MAYTSWDKPVTDAEMARHYGVSYDPDTSVADAARNAIRAIPAHRMTPEVAAAILATVSARVALLSEAASQYIDDAIFILGES